MAVTRYENCNCCGSLTSGCCPGTNIPKTIYGQICGTLPEKLCSLIGVTLEFDYVDTGGFKGWKWTNNGVEECKHFLDAEFGVGNLYPVDSDTCNTACVFAQMYLFCGIDNGITVFPAAGWEFAAQWYYSDCSEDITKPDFPIHWGGYIFGHSLNNPIFPGLGGSTCDPFHFVVDSTHDVLGNDAVLVLSATPPTDCLPADDCEPIDCEPCHEDSGSGGSGGSSGSSGSGGGVPCVPCMCDDTAANCFKVDFGNPPAGDTCCANAFGVHFLNVRDGCSWAQDANANCPVPEGGAHRGGQWAGGWRIDLVCYDPGNGRMVTVWWLTLDTDGTDGGSPVFEATLSQFSCQTGGTFNLLSGDGHCDFYPTPVRVVPCPMMLAEPPRQRVIRNALPKTKGCGKCGKKK